MRRRNGDQDDPDPLLPDDLRQPRRVAKDLQPRDPLARLLGVVVHEGFRNEAAGVAHEVAGQEGARLAGPDDESLQSFPFPGRLGVEAPGHAKRPAEEDSGGEHDGQGRARKEDKAPDAVHEDKEQGGEEVELAEAHAVLQAGLGPQNFVLAEDREDDRRQCRKGDRRDDAVPRVERGNEEAEPYGVSQVAGEGEEQEVEQRHDQAAVGCPVPQAECRQQKTPHDTLAAP